MQPQGKGFQKLFLHDCEAGALRPRGLLGLGGWSNRPAMDGGRVSELGSVGARRNALDTVWAARRRRAFRRQRRLKQQRKSRRQGIAALC